MVMLSLANAQSTQPAPVAYRFNITTTYQNSITGIGGTASPDSGGVTIKNTGQSTYSGLLGISGTANSGGSLYGTTYATLAPGQSMFFVVGGESSNVGGFNGTNGVQILIYGRVTLGTNSQYLTLSVYDKDIHSGVYRMNPFGVYLDNYVLEGGDATRDTGDSYETSQADGHYTFQQFVGTPTTSITGGPSENSTVGANPIDFTFTGSDQLTSAANLTYKYSVDGGAYVGPTSSTSVSLTLADGAHTFQVAAINENGDIDPNPPIRHFTVDTLLPTVGNIRLSQVDDANAILLWDSNKPTTSQIFFRVSGTTVFQSTSVDVNYLLSHSVLISGLQPNTTYEYYVQSVDRLSRSADNFSNLATFQTLPDTTPPDTAITAGPLNGGYVRPGTFTFQWVGQDDVTLPQNLRYLYQIDGGIWLPADGSGNPVPTSATAVSLPFTADGQHSFAVRAIDEAGNTNDGSNPAHPLAQVTFVVDSTLPSISSITCTNSRYNALTVNIGTSKPTTVTVEYAPDDGSSTLFPSVYSSGYDYNFASSHSITVGPLLSNTQYRLLVIATDREGNMTTQEFRNSSCKSAPLRDLGVASADITYLDPTDPTGNTISHPAAGDTVVMRAVVRNLGDLPAGATLVFYDSTIALGDREISRVTLPTINAYTSNGYAATSASFPVTEGLHKPYVTLINPVPGDDIATDNSAEQDLIVNAPALRFSIGTSDPKTWPGNDSLFTVSVTNTGSQAQSVSAITITGPSWLTQVSDLPTDPDTGDPDPIQPGQTIQVTYHLTPPTALTGGTIANPVLVPVTLALPGGSSTFNIEVYSGPVASQPVQVIDATTNTPIPNATIAVDYSDQQWVTGIHGRPLDNMGVEGPINAPGGSHTVYAIAQGYQPASQSFGSGNPVVIALNPGKSLEIQQITVQQLTPQQIIDRGVSLTDPANYDVFDFVVAMRIQSLPVHNIVLPTRPSAGQVVSGQIISGGSGGGAGGGGGGGGGGGYGGGTYTVQYQFTYPVANRPDIRSETWIVIPGDVRILKQFWEATIFVKNNTDYSIINASASLDIPPGLSLPDLSGISQPLSMTLTTDSGNSGTILPHTQASAQWVIRGDRAGTYTLTGHASGQIVLGGSTVTVDDSLRSPAFDVAQPKLTLSFQTPTSVVAGQNFTLGIDVRNDSTIDVNFAQANIHASKLLNCVLNDLASKPIGNGVYNTIKVGETVHVDFVFTSLVTGTVDEVVSYVTDGTIEPPVSVSPAATVPPVANADAAATTAGSSVDINVVANDTDVDPGVQALLKVKFVSNGANGGVVTKSDKIVTYTPNPGFVGDDTFTYTIVDPVGNMASANVSVHVDATAPALTALTPNSSATVAAGGADVPITVSGSGFTIQSTVLWNGTALTTKFLSTSLLQATIPAASLATAGSANITVSNPAPGGTSKALVFLIGNPNVQVKLNSLTRVGTNLQASVSLTNSGVSIATTVKVTGGVLKSTSTSSTVPMTVGTLKPGDATTITLVFPGSAASSGTSTKLKVAGSFDGGSFLGTLNVTAP